MESSTTNATAPAVLHLPAELTIFRAAELKQLLLAEPHALEINLSAVTEIDSAGVQLLMLAKQTAQAAQRELRLVAHSPAVLEVFELLNIAGYFGDPLVMAASTASSTRRSHGS